MTADEELRTPGLRGEAGGGFLRGKGLGIGGALLFAALGFGAVRWFSGLDRATAARKTHQFTMVKVLPDRPPRPPPTPPKPPEPQKHIEQPRASRVDLKANEMVAPPSTAAPAPPSGGGRLSLATAGQGPGDAFNLAGNPGGRGLLSGGGLGDGSGEGLGGGGPGSRFGQYYAKVAIGVEEAFRRAKRLNMLSARLELRIWIDREGRITRVAPLRAGIDPKLEEALQSIVGLRIEGPPPADIPMPMIARLTARRTQ